VNRINESTRPAVAHITGNTGTLRIQVEHTAMAAIDVAFRVSTITTSVVLVVILGSMLLPGSGAQVVNTVPDGLKGGFQPDGGYLGAYPAGCISPR
jgi:hypothetical protein